MSHSETIKKYKILIITKYKMIIIRKFRVLSILKYLVDQNKTADLKYSAD